MVPSKWIKARWGSRSPGIQGSHTRTTILWGIMSTVCPWVCWELKPWWGAAVLSALARGTGSWYHLIPCCLLPSDWSRWHETKNKRSISAEADGPFISTVKESGWLKGVETMYPGAGVWEGRKGNFWGGRFRMQAGSPAVSKLYITKVSIFLSGVSCVLTSWRWYQHSWTLLALTACPAPSPPPLEELEGEGAVWGGRKANHPQKSRSKNLPNTADQGRW